MRKRLVVVLSLCLLGSMGISHAEDVQPALHAGYSAGASWSTQTAEVSVTVGNRGDGTPIDQYAYISVFRFGWFVGRGHVVIASSSGGRSAASAKGSKFFGFPGWEFPGCETAVKLQSGQLQVDPALASATLTIPSTPCGPVSISWNASGDPQPVTGAGASPYPLDYVDAGGNAGLRRPAIATGSVGTDSLASDQLNGGDLFVGVSGSVFFDRYPVFASAALFKGASVEIHQGRTIGRIFGYNYVASGGTGFGTNFGATGNETYGCLELFTPMPPTRSLKGRYNFFFGQFRCGPISLTLDPGLATGRIVANFGSLSADVSFASTASLTPDHDLAPAPSPSASDPLPSFAVGGSIYATRVATATGVMQSKWAKLSVNQSDAQLSQGVNATLWHGFPCYTGPAR